MKHLQSILDCMSGADGGVRFAHLRQLVIEMEQKAAAGDLAAKDVLKVVERFDRLIQVANNRAEQTQQEQHHVTRLEPQQDRQQ